MKYCQHCGKEIADDAVICVHCGRQVQAGADAVSAGAKEPAFKGAGIGFVMSFFVGVVGFILCLCMGDRPCRKSATITFIISTIIGIILGVIYVVVILNIMDDIPAYYY